MIHTVSPVRVRYAETDRMDVVYHSHYFVWFETARILLLDAMDQPYAQLEAAGYRIPVLQANAEYLLPARFDDRLKIHIYMREKPRARFRFDYTVERDNTLLSRGSTTHAFMDRAGKALRPPTAFLEKIDLMWQQLPE